MNTFPIFRYRISQQLQPLSLLSQITSNSSTSCLQVFSAEESWLIYVEKGKLVYACYLNNMFELLDKKLQHLSQEILTLNSETNQQLRAIFETGVENQITPRPDYMAICWLVEHKYISSEQASILIKELALEVLKSFLTLDEGNYEITPESFLNNMPKFCYLDVPSLVEQCQNKSANPKNIESAVSQLSDFQPLNHIQPPAETKIGQELLQQSIIIDNNIPNQQEQYTNEKIYTIVCIDDSLTVLNVMKLFLDDQIFSVIGINDPLKALTQVIRSKPDLILLDVEMPNIGGYEFCRLLRKHSYFKTTPIIMVTGRTGFKDRAKAKIVRSSGYLTKPFTKAELLKIVFQNIG
ncbi:response regulator receiver protein [Tolypothrix sp. NIES-4075]|uniref:response regulator n=1 Tax=Tolypothrix sp. NIES-4075 TaxID=2005459 RepID=UPI000B5C9E0F|nr:response regulator [Tolypothrix sp. NIES-4075]GAX39808.1 response regulator receiver protein [Tolypothrix sp. NIES-4075]